jgi:hypothetical protein
LLKRFSHGNTMTKDKSPEFFLGISLELFLNVNTIIFAILVYFFLTILFSPEHFDATRIKEDVIVILLYNCPNDNREIIIKHRSSLEGQSPSIPFLQNLKRICFAILVIVNSSHMLAVINSKCISEY